MGVEFLSNLLSFKDVDVKTAKAIRKDVRKIMADNVNQEDHDWREHSFRECMAKFGNHDLPYSQELCYQEAPALYHIVNGLLDKQYRYMQKQKDTEVYSDEFTPRTYKKPRKKPSKSVKAKPVKNDKGRKKKQGKK